MDHSNDLLYQMRSVFPFISACDLDTSLGPNNLVVTDIIPITLL